MFVTIINDKSFAEHFTVKGEELKKVPKGYDAEHPQAEYLKFKSWYLESPVADSALAEADAFIKQAAEIFKLMKPFNDYLNVAMADFKMPER